MKYIGFIVFSILLFLPSAGFGDDKVSKESWTMVPTQNHTLESRILKKNIRLQISVPEKYNTEEKKYGVIYYLDAFALGGTVREAAAWLQVDNEIPELITVGIELEVNTAGEWFKERAFILTPTKSGIYEDFGIPEAWTGSGADFLRCIKEEIIPFIEGKYNTMENERTLVGHSFGGLFALYTLFDSPKLFNRLLVSSPSLPWDDRFIFKMESEYAKKHKELSANVFLSAGSLENLPDDMMVHQLKEFSTVLELRKYKGLDITGIVFEGESHYSVIFPAFSKGLRTLYQQESADSEKDIDKPEAE